MTTREIGLFCKYTERATLRMLSENIYREKLLNSTLSGQ